MVSGVVYSWLDKFLVRDGDSSWVDGVIQQAVLEFSLNNLPIVFCFGEVSLGPRPFRFLNA